MKPALQMAKAFALLSGIGIYFAMIVGICVYLGMLADDYLLLDGRGRLIGILLSFPVAIYSTYRQLRNNSL